MKNSHAQALCLIAAALFCCATARADDLIGDVSAEADAIYTGSTYHGYAEVRVTLENRSRDQSHVVNLIYPNNSFGEPVNYISRISRTVTLAPGAREMVTLYQPPLPLQGDSSMRVVVDGSVAGLIRGRNVNSHRNLQARGPYPAVLFVSRGLVLDDIENLFQDHPKAPGFTAAMATGPPDVDAGGLPNAWMPDSSPGAAGSSFEWLEVDYAKPQTVNQITVCFARPGGHDGTIHLVRANGDPLPEMIPMNSFQAPIPGDRPLTKRYVIPLTDQPIKSVRLEFHRQWARNVAIDAVQISGPSGSQWASEARASSDASERFNGWGGDPARTAQTVRSDSAVADWSDNWLAYSPFNGVVLSAKELKTMPPGVRDALGTYLWTGGVVVLSGKTELPPGWHPSQTTPLADGTEYEVGFGSCFLFTPDNLAATPAESLAKLRSAVRETQRYWAGLPADGDSPNSLLPIVQNLKIPTRGVVLVMLAFIIVIGPVNIIVLNLTKRRTWMLWTIPAISCATTLFVFAYSLFHEGVIPNARIGGLTIIDQTTHHVATIGGEAFYCPLTPSGGLDFTPGTEATPLVSVGTGGGTAREVDWSDGQHFGNGWVSARVPAFFHLRKCEVRSEGIRVNSGKGKVQIVNGLGVPLKSLWFSDNSMNVYEAHEIPAGQTAELALSRPTNNLSQSGVEGLLRKVQFSAQPEVLANPTECLRPNTYIAVLDGNPFLENALGSPSRVVRTKSSAIVFGILERAVVK